MDMTLPEDYQVIYQSKPPASFQGDGISFLVIEYSDWDALQVESFSYERDQGLEDEVHELLNLIEIDPRFRPNFH